MTPSYPLAGHAVEPDVLLGGGEDGLAHNPLELHWLRQHGGLGATAPTLHVGAARDCGEPVSGARGYFRRVVNGHKGGASIRASRAGVG